MNLFRLHWSRVCVGAVVGSMVVGSAPARAQAFVEGAGGWNYVAPTPSNASYGNGFNVQVSVGRQVAPTLSWRVDALASQFDVAEGANRPCLPFGCSGPGYSFRHVGVNGLIGSVLVQLEPQGRLYLIGGGGLYDVNARTATWHFGASVGAGIAIPIATRLRAVAEARWHELGGSNDGPPWVVPVTIGLRY